MPPATLQPYRHCRPVVSDRVEAHQDEPSDPDEGEDNEEDAVPERLPFLVIGLHALGEECGIAPVEHDDDDGRGEREEDEEGPGRGPAPGAGRAEEERGKEEDLDGEGDCDLSKDGHPKVKIPSFSTSVLLRPMDICDDDELIPDHSRGSVSAFRVKNGRGNRGLLPAVV